MDAVEALSLLQVPKEVVAVPEGVRLGRSGVNTWNDPQGQPLDLAGLSLQPNDPRFTPPDPDPEPAVDQPSGIILPPSVVASQPMPGSQAVAAGHRVAIYNSRAPGFFSVCVEVAPDWDTKEDWRLADNVVVAVLPILTALGIKLADKTGGDLREAMREQSAVREVHEPAPVAVQAADRSGDGSAADRPATHDAGRANRRRRAAQ